ncbi:MAG: hypothetical protein AUI16_01030 [Alphaproteobacteria bacterium 13_2_20CM_2_64_7]|jgi:hypothetical protein|nr:MAG: hypothetical protein AUI16_01030 [Alphaproteobacteria bacterium 13_2_20CM_2_64_7]
MSVNAELSPRDVVLFIAHLDGIASRFTTACENAEATVAEALGADNVPTNVNQVGERLLNTLNQVRRDAERQFAQLRTACADAIAGGDTW